VSIALAAAGFDAREVPAQRMAAQRRARRLDYRRNRRINTIFYIASVTQEHDNITAQNYRFHYPLLPFIECST